MKKLAFASVIIVTSLLPAQLSAQDLTFFRLDKTDGLSDNLVTSVVADNSGLLWVGTSNGLNSYNGYTVRKFNSKDYPGLANDEIVRMVCDLENRIWIQCRNGELTVLDENRNFQRINLSSGDSAISSF
jgi:ligand-binding sensor domain-containing protein